MANMVNMAKYRPNDPDQPNQSNRSNYPDQPKPWPPPPPPLRHPKARYGTIPLPRICRLPDDRFMGPFAGQFACNSYALAKSLMIPHTSILALVDAGYLRAVPFENGSYGYWIVKGEPPSRVIDRMGLALWMLDMDSEQSKVKETDRVKMGARKNPLPRFSANIEKEIMRIVKLPEPVRTEQALRMILRFRDAEDLVVALAKAKADDIARIEKEKLSRRYRYKMNLKARLARLAGMEESDWYQGRQDKTSRANRDRDQEQSVQGQVQARAASQPVPKAVLAGLPRKPRSAAVQ